MHSHWRSCQDWANSGLTLSTPSNEACKLYDAALSQYVGWYELEDFAGLDSTLQAVKQSDPHFVMGHVLSNGLDLLSTGKNPNTDEQLQQNINNMVSMARHQALTGREQLHVQALQHWAEGNFLKAAQVWEVILIEFPTDLLALKFAHDTYFYTGESAQIRDSVARVLPRWNPTMPHYGYLHGMHAFGLVETNLFRQAELAAKKGLLYNKHDGWSSHALAHVYEMEGRTDEGILYLLNSERDWEVCGLLACHNYWHWALYHIEDGNYKTALNLYEEKISNFLKEDSLLNIVDCASFLFRLRIAGYEPPAELWRDLWATCEPHLDDHVTTFNDIHFLFACLGSGHEDSAVSLFESIQNLELDEESHLCRTRPFHEDLFKAVTAFCENDYNTTIDLLFPIRYDLRIIGGSNAQRDIFNILLITACMKSDNSQQQELGRRLIWEREALKEKSPMTHRLMAQALTTH